VPEVYDGLITIKKVVREPGERAKSPWNRMMIVLIRWELVWVMKGSRIHAIVRELKTKI